MRYLAREIFAVYLEPNSHIKAISNDLSQEQLDAYIAHQLELPSINSFPVDMYQSYMTASHCQQFSYVSGHRNGFTLSPLEKWLPQRDIATEADRLHIGIGKTAMYDAEGVVVATPDVVMHLTFNNNNNTKNQAEMDNTPSCGPKVQYEAGSFFFKSFGKLLCAILQQEQKNFLELITTKFRGSGATVNKETSSKSKKKQFKDSHIKKQRYIPFH
jgi:hypothetical protein